MSNNDYGQKWANEKEFKRQNNESLALVMGMCYIPLFLVAACCGFQNGCDNQSTGCGCAHTQHAPAQTNCTNATKTVEYNDARIRYLQQQIDSLKHQKKSQLTK